MQKIKANLCIIQNVFHFERLYPFDFPIFFISCTWSVRERRFENYWNRTITKVEIYVWLHDHWKSNKWHKLRMDINNIIFVISFQVRWKMVLKRYWLCDAILNLKMVDGLSPFTKKKILDKWRCRKTKMCGKISHDTTFWKPFWSFLRFDKKFFLKIPVIQTQKMQSKIYSSFFQPIDIYPFLL